MRTSSAVPVPMRNSFAPVMQSSIDANGAPCSERSLIHESLKVCAVMAIPSLNFASLRSVKVHLFLSREILYDSHIAGMGSSVTGW